MEDFYQRRKDRLAKILSLNKIFYNIHNLFVNKGLKENTLKFILKYSTTDNTKEELNKMHKEDIANLLLDLLDTYLNDKNSSTLRELIPLVMLGAEPSQEKLGYNGLIQNRKIEVKPQNIDTSEKRKLDGGGSFNDYTPERFKSHENDNPLILSAGYIEGKLIYILEFGFDCIKNKLKEQLERRFPKEQREAGQYLRSAYFSFKDYKKCENLRVLFIRMTTLSTKNSKELFEFLNQVKQYG